MTRRRSPTRRERVAGSSSRAATLVVLGVAALLAVSILSPRDIASATNSVLYLAGGAVPKADLTTNTPPSTPLPNYDPGRDSAPGLVLSKTDAGWAETDPTKYQMWVAEPGTTLDGDVTLTVWSAIKDFEATKGATLSAYLVDCTPGGQDCTVIDTASSTVSPWSPSGWWVDRTFSFGSVHHTSDANRSLAVKIVVDGSSDDDVWLAYGTAEYPARLTIDGSVTTSTTTTTTSTSATTTTTTTTTTTIAAPTSPPTTPAPTVPAEEPERTITTTMTEVPREGTSSPPPPGAEDPPDADLHPISGADPIIATLGGTASADAPADRGAWGVTIVDSLELVIPPWAAQLVASPLLVFLFVIASLTDSGREILLPTVVLMIGLAAIVAENRFRSVAVPGRGTSP